MYEFNDLDSEDYYSSASLSYDYRVLYFRKGVNPATKAQQWQARQRNSEKTVVYVPVEKMGYQQPANDQEVWLCVERSVIAESPDGQFKVISVELLNKLFVGEITLHFRLDDRRLVDGKIPWNSYIGANICTPDRYGKNQPSADHDFWFCRFRKVAHVGKHGSVIAVMDLLREDVETKAQHFEQLRRDEELRVAAEQEKQVREAEEAERRAESLRPWQEHQRALDAQRQAREKLEVEQPEFFERLRRLEMNEKAMGIR